MSEAFFLRWRKLYRFPSTAWLALPLSARGLGDALVRVADDDGSVYVGKDKHAETLARLLQAHRDEYKRVAKDFALLLADGFCAVEGERLWIKNFSLAQEPAPASFDPSVPPSNNTEAESREERAARLHRERTARYRSNKRVGDGGDATRDGLGDAAPSQPPSPRDAAGDAPTVTGGALPSQTLPSEEREERREEEKKAKPSSSAGAGASDAQTVTATVTESVTSPLACPRLRDVLDAVSHWSKGRISEIVTTADGTDLKTVIETLYERDRIVLHDYELLGAWACKQTGGPGFPTLRKPPSWNFLLGDDRKGSRLVEALGEARHWERLQDEKEKRCG